MLNKIDLMGRLTADPELRRTANGIEVASCAVACDRDIKDKDGNRPTDFFDVVAWRGTAKFLCDYWRKGDMIAVSGRLQTRSWKDRDGNNRHSVEIVADNIYFCGKKNDTSNTYDESAVKEPEIAEIEESDGELPF